VESSAAQRQMILAAAKAKVSPSQFDVLSVMMSAAISPAMKERNKLAHWCWGYSPELSDCLLLCKPDHKMVLHLQAVNVRRMAPEVPFDASSIFVVTESDVSRLADRLRTAKQYVSLFMAAVWKANSPEVRERFFLQLSNEPPIREALERSNENHRKNPATQQPSPPPNQSGNGRIRDKK
jgi:hypothetical protein